MFTSLVSKAAKAAKQKQSASTTTNHRSTSPLLRKKNKKDNAPSMIGSTIDASKTQHTLSQLSNNLDSEVSTYEKND